MEILSISGLLALGIVSLASMIGIRIWMNSKDKKWIKAKLICKKSLSYNVFEQNFVIDTGKHLKLMCIGEEGREIVRNYTPISHGPGHFNLLIKIYPKGKMTQHLNGMAIGGEIYVSLPEGRFDYALQGAYDGFLMLGGGTGITPLWQIIRDERFAFKEKRLIFANVTEDDILLRRELEEKVGKYFQIEFILNQPSLEWKGKVGFITQKLVKEEIAKIQTNHILVLICGPPPMVREMKTICADCNLKYFVF